MPSSSDIAFDCPHCRGPLMAEASHEGETCECPHCYSHIQIPKADVVNKDKFVEPLGLRRVLKQVQDREWEMLRRKLRAAKARNAELESELHRTQAVLAERTAAPKPSDDKAREVETVRKQLAEMSEQFVQASQAFMAGRKQQEAVIEHLRHQLGAAREETESFGKKNEELAIALQATQLEVAKARDEKTPQENHPEQAAEIERLSQELADMQSKLEVEQAKVLVMEAAGVSPEGAVPANDVRNDVLIHELQIQIAELRKANDSLRAARDKAYARVAEMQKQLGENPADDQSFEMALNHLEDDLNEVLGMIAARKASSGKGS